MYDELSNEYLQIIRLLAALEKEGARVELLHMLGELAHELERLRPAPLDCRPKSNLNNEET